MDTEVDAFLTEHDGAYVLIMTPIVARVIADMSGSLAVSENSLVKDTGDTIWNEMRHLCAGEYLLQGDLTLTPFGEAYEGEEESQATDQAQEGTPT